jgi:hypothetical protein
MNHLLRSGLLTLCLTVAASAVPIVQTWNFTGTCSDCPDFGFGTLTTSTENNVVSFNFAYSSDWLTYTMNAATVLVNTGNGWSLFNGSSFDIAPGMSLIFRQTASVTSFGGAGNPIPVGVSTQPMYFDAFSDGTWSTGVYLPSDFGTNGAWTSGSSAVPEPSTLALAAFGGATLLFFRRRRSVA